jgi:hypothetical protein
MIGIIRTLCASNDVTPPGAELCSRRYAYHGIVFVLDVFVTSKGRIVDVRDGVVGIRRTDALELALIDAVNRDSLKDTVSCGGGCQRGE